MTLQLDGDGVWVPLWALKEFFDMKVGDVTSMLTHVKPMYRGPPLRAKGYKTASDGKTKYICIARGSARALWKLSPVRWKFTPRCRSAYYEFTAGGALMHNQKIVCEWIMRKRLDWKSVRAGVGVCYVVAGAGTGKTHIGVECARVCGGKTLVLASRIPIGKQWRDVAVDYVNNYDAVVLAEHAKKKRAELVASADMVITTPQTALKFSPDEWAEFAMVIFDEIQQFSAGKWRELMCAPVPRMLGLTASPKDRPDTMDCIGYWRLGRPVRASSLEGFNRSEVHFHGNARMVHRSCDELARKLADASYPERVQALAEDRERARDIAKECRGLLVLKDVRVDAADVQPLMDGVAPCSQLNVMIFAERRAGVELIVEEINALLRKNPIAEGDLQALDPEIMEIKGGATEEELARACAGARVIVTTFAYASVGVSFDHMNAMIVDSSRKSNFYQVIKRIMRAKSDVNVIRHYVHIVDEDFKQFRSRMRKHERVYQAIGVDVTHQVGR